ncbi:MAG TPA: hypothetical protein VEK75_17895 [Xanthobacteraceae bacterium]|nr:hypothetical protein [Xanthobacteraceae bacterium]
MAAAAKGVRMMAAVCVAGGLAGLAVAPADAIELVTKEEAALPAGPPPALQLRGSPTRRPKIVIVSPPPGAGLVHSPLDLKLQFNAHGGGQIDPSSVVVTYLKQPAIDITQRITPFITADGVDITQAELPPGKHQFWVELKDKDGRIGGAEIDFQVAK